MWKIIELNEKPEICNNNKILKYCPVKTNTNKLIVQYDWYNKQSLEYKKRLEMIFPDFEFQNFNFPNNDVVENKLFGLFLKNYVEYYDFGQYDELLFNSDQYIKYSLNSSEIQNLLEISIKYKDKDNLFTEEELINVHPNLLQLFELVVEKFESCFVKTSFKSAKKGKYGIFPCYSSVDIINNLIHCTDIIFSLLRDNISLIFTKWNFDIKKENEFRLFIFNGKLVNISQNYPSIHMRQHFNETFINKIQEFCDKLHSKINIKYACDYVIDVFYNNNEIYLIEINSGGLWSTCASSLFDYNNMTDYEFRYIY